MGVGSVIHTDNGVVPMNGKFVIIGRVVFFVVCAVLIIINFAEGPRSSPDTSTYSHWADALVQNQFNFIAFFEETSFVGPIYLYTATITIVAVAKVLFAGHWKLGLLIVNLGCIPILIFLASRLANLSNLNKYCVTFFPLIFLLSDAYLFWPSFILSDTIFSMILMWCVYCVITTGQKASWQRNSVFIASVALLLVSRPSSPPAVAVLLLLFFIPRFTNYIGRSQYLVVALLFSVFIVLMAWATLMYAYLSDLIPDQTQLTWLADKVKKGWVISGRLETYVMYDNTYVSVVQLYLSRFLYFFAPYAQAFSIAHTLINLVFFTVVGMAIAIGEVCVDFSKSTNPIALKARGVLFPAIGAIATFHSMMIVDFDWRYRYPTIALLVLLAVVEISLFLQQKSFGSSATLSVSKDQQFY